MYSVASENLGYSHLLVYKNRDCKSYALTAATEGFDQSCFDVICFIYLHSVIQVVGYVPYRLEVDATFSFYRVCLGFMMQ